MPPIDGGLIGIIGCFNIGAPGTFVGGGAIVGGNPFNEGINLFISPIERGGTNGLDGTIGIGAGIGIRLIGGKFIFLIGCLKPRLGGFMSFTPLIKFFKKPITIP